MINTEDTTFKIGQSKRPRYREGTLQSKQPGIALLKAWQCDKRIEKAALHHYYREKRVRGEWFRLNLGDLVHFEDTISKIKSQYS